MNFLFFIYIFAALARFNPLKLVALESRIAHLKRLNALPEFYRKRIYGVFIWLYCLSLSICNIFRPVQSYNRFYDIFGWTLNMFKWFYPIHTDGDVFKWYRFSSMNICCELFVSRNLDLTSLDTFIYKRSSGFFSGLFPV